VNFSFNYQQSNLRTYPALRVLGRAMKARNKSVTNERALGNSDDRSAAGFAAPRAVASKNFELVCVCAVHDKPYILRFERQATGLLRFTKTIRMEGQGSEGAHAPSGTEVYSPIDTHSLKEFEKSAMPCAWCGDGSFNLCTCNALVCGGRSVGETFRCRPSCGAEWVGVPLQEVQGSARREEHHWKRAPASASPARPSRVVNETRLTLTSGQSGALDVRRK
jgi:hypothetical protein